MERIKKLIIFLILIGTSCDSGYNYVCNAYKEFYSLKLDGQITNKVVDKKQHSYLYLTILNNDNQERKIHIMSDKIWEMINIGDSIKKAKFTDKFILTRNNNYEQEIRLTFNCSKENREKIRDEINNE